MLIEHILHICDERIVERLYWVLELMLVFRRGINIPLVCPKCEAGSLKIISSIELAPDSRSDEISVQITKCSQCGFNGLALYEASRRGALNRESVAHRGYYVNPAKLSALHRRIQQCPEPRSPQCHCEVHRAIGSVNTYGRWNGLKDILNTASYNIQLR
jgi:hypothetical protein